MITPRYAQLVQDADGKSARGDFERAINLCEAALDDRLNDPLNVLHDFRRYRCSCKRCEEFNET